MCIEIFLNTFYNINFIIIAKFLCKFTFSQFNIILHRL